MIVSFTRKHLCALLSDLMIETAQSTDHVTSADALVYAVGSLKFLSGNGTLLKHLHKRGCFQAMSKLLLNINKMVRKLYSMGKNTSYEPINKEPCHNYKCDLKI